MNLCKMLVTFAIAALASITSQGAELRFEHQETKTVVDNSGVKTHVILAKDHLQELSPVKASAEPAGPKPGFSHTMTVGTSLKSAQYKMSHAGYRMAWMSFKRKYGKQYKFPLEEEQRFANFIDSLKRIERHNKKYRKGLTSYWMDINQFSDQSWDDMTAMRPRLDLRAAVKSRAKVSDFGRKVGPQQLNHSDLGPHRGLPHMGVPPSEWDWRTQGYVTPVKDQGPTCGSSWAFSTTGSLEGQWFAKTQHLESFSEQQLVDCSTDYGNNGCTNGSIVASFDYIVDIAGLQNDTTYPYKGRVGNCSYNESLAVAKIHDAVEYELDGDERALQLLVSTVGPVSVVMATGPNFQAYKGGVFDDPTCNKNPIDHSALVVGYATSYWIVKNSWGPEWGEKGYIRIARGKNMCFVASYAIYPLV